jgi:hypothetical protein
MKVHLEEGVEVVEALEEEEEDEGDKTLTRPFVECYYCHKLGHFQYECPELKKEANYVKADEEMLLMADVNCQNANRESVWFLDSGCSNHMCGKKEIFSDFDTKFREFVKLGNNSSMAVMGKAT